MSSLDHVCIPYSVVKLNAMLLCRGRLRSVAWHLVSAYRGIKTTNINVKTKFIKTVIRDVVAHPKPQKFTVSSEL